MAYEDTLQFLRAVLPSVPRYVSAVQRKGGGMIQTFHETVESLAHHQVTVDEAGKTVYFALGAFGPADNREQANVHALKSLWMDVDVGEDKAAQGKGYATQEAAMEAIESLVDKGFPDYSYLVSSGRGLHVYWVIDSDTPKAQWQIAADAFQRAWQGLGIIADPVSADSARVLRAPGTTHRKAAPLPVSVIEVTGELHRIADLHAAAMALSPVPAQTSKVAQLETNDDLLANLPERQAWLSAIAAKCGQVKGIAQTRGKDCSEPLWYAAVQLARHLVNGVEVAHYLSDGHPDYDAGAVTQKLEQLESRDIGPTTCDKFRTLNPAGCQGCKWKITSPIQLGEKAPEPAKARILVQELEVTENGAEIVERELTPPVEAPRGFMFTESGTAAEVFDDKGIASWKVIFPGQIFPTRVFRAPGRPLEMEVYSCRDGTKEVNKFTIPAVKVGEAKETRNVLMGHIMIDSTNATHLQRLLNGMGMAIQSQVRTGLSVRQFGWQLADPATARHFVYGRIRFSPDGVERNIAVDDSVESLADRLCVPAGSMAGAVEGASLYNRPGAQMHQAVYLTGLAGVFAPYTGAQNFAVLSLVSKIGGEGKTTNCDAAMSHWFNPQLARSSPRDTQNALYNTMSARGTLPVFIDEVTNAKPEVAVDLIYTASQGREKARMEQSGAKQRDPLPPWKCPILTTANMSVKQLVRANRGDASALDARIVEMYYTRIDLPPQDRSRITTVFYENYGWTGPAVAKHVASRFDEYAKMAELLRAKLLEQMGWDGADRFWLNWGIGVLMACRAMNVLGLAGYNLSDLFKYVAALILQQRAQKQSELRSGVDILAEFLAENAGRVVVGYKVDGHEGAARLNTVYDQGRVTAVVGRTQLDERIMYLSPAAVRDFCTDKGYDYRSLVAEFAEIGLLARSIVVDQKDGKPVRSPDVPTKYSLGRGTPMASAPSKVLALSLEHTALRGHLADAETAVKSQGIRVVTANVEPSNG